eukprot:1062621-Rhodomonas_salina.2
MRLLIASYQSRTDSGRVDVPGRCHVMMMDPASGYQSLPPSAILRGTDMGGLVLANARSTGKRAVFVPRALY